MDRQRLPVTHQQERDFGRPLLHKGHDAAGGLRPPVPGQQDGRSLHQPSRGDKIAFTLSCSSKPLADCSIKRRLGYGILGAKARESVIRYAVKKPVVNLGVLSGQRSSPQPLGSVVHPSTGRVRQQVMPCSPSILQLVSRQPSSVQGCIFGYEVAGQSLLLSSRASDSSNAGKDPGQWDTSDCGSSRVEDCSLVGHTGSNDSFGAHKSGILQENSEVSNKPDASIPASTSGLSGEGKQASPLLTNQAKSLLNQDIRLATTKIYASRFRIFSKYCHEVGSSPTDCPVEVITNFLAKLSVSDKLSYRTICGYRAAISRYHRGFGRVSLGQEQLIKRVTKACFNSAPPLPKYSDMWDADVLMQYLESMHPNSELSTYDLGVKAVSLLTVLSISRQSSVAALAPQFQFINDEVHINIVYTIYVTYVCCRLLFLL